MYALWDVSVHGLGDTVFTPFEESFFNAFVNVKDSFNKISKDFISSNFPPCDIYQSQDESFLFYEMAVAGYPRENIKVSYKDDYLTVSLTAPKKDEEFLYAQKGIKHKDSETSYFVPSKKYDVQKMEVALREGILLIKIPLKEESKKMEIEIH